MVSGHRQILAIRKGAYETESSDLQRHRPVPWFLVVRQGWPRPGRRRPVSLLLSVSFAYVARGLPAGELAPGTVVGAILEIELPVLPGGRQTRSGWAPKPVMRAVSQRCGYF